MLWISFHRRLVYRCFCTFVLHSAVISLTTLTTRGFPCFVTTSCSLCIFCTILLCSFSLLHFRFGLARSLLASLTGQTLHHRPILLANSTPASTAAPLSPPPCCLLAHAPFAFAVSFFFCLFFCPATLNSIQVLQPLLCALSTCALFSNLFILLHYLI